MNVWFLLWTGLCTLIDNCWAKDHSCSWQPHEWQQKPWPWWQQMGSLANESVFEGSPVKKNTSRIRICWKWRCKMKKKLEMCNSIQSTACPDRKCDYIFYTCLICTFTWKDCIAGHWFSKLFCEIDFHVSVKTIRKNFFDYL